MDADGRFFFLEVNTRLQVEHPVTELITGLDLVRLQIEIAQGAPLPDEAVNAAINGHAIEARLYAEDVAAGFVPVSGQLHRVHIPSGPHVRVDSGYESGSTVSTFYDAMLAKVIAWAPTRSHAVALLGDSLRRAELHGVVTNRDLLVNTLAHPEFGAGRTDTAFLERNDFRVLGGAGMASATTDRIHALAAALAPATVIRSPQPAGVPPGWRSVGVARTTFTFTSDDQRITVLVERSRSGVRASVDTDAIVDIDVHTAAVNEVEFELLGIRHRVRLHHVGRHVYADSALGSSDLVRVDRFPLPEAQVGAGSLVAPMPGTVIAVMAAAGDAVVAGQTLVAIEAMKMEHAIRCPVAGTVIDVRIAVGQQVDGGAVLVVVDADETD